jgi:NAD-dependent dihydropyrimidine dehydrogenase PreA subunit
MRKRTIVWSVVLLLVAGILASILPLVSGATRREVVFSTSWSLRETAKHNGLPLKKVLHVMSHDDHRVWTWPRNKPIADLPVTPARVRQAIAHVLGETAVGWAVLKFLLWAACVPVVLLTVLTRHVIRTVRIVWLVGVVVIFGVVLGASPNPMEALVKTGKALNHMEAEPWAAVVGLAIFTVLSLAGPKFVCSWGCHLGALQESLFNLPVMRIKRAWRVPFGVSLAVRAVLFVGFVLLLFTAWFGLTNFVVYHHVNYFKLFDPAELARFALYLLPVFVVASVLIYRPFCQFICPFGLYAWALQDLSVHRIEIDRDACIACEQCIDACPTEAMKGLFAGKRRFFLPDCWSCGQCVESCSQGAIRFAPTPRPGARG